MAVVENIIPLDLISSKKKADEWSVLLNSRDVAHSISKASMGWVILVRERDKERAEYEIKIYEEENRKGPVLTEVELHDVNKYFFILTVFLLCFFHFIVVITNPEIGWLRSGSSQASAVMGGQLWRAVTALTLHKNIAHLLSNVLVGSVFVWALCRQAGSGLAWLLTLITGAMGNIMNAFLFGTQHSSIGASTAVFGALGVLGALKFYKAFRLSGLKPWLPFAAAVALLGFLGASRETDITAHLFGFMAGIALGAILGLYLTYKGHFKMKAQYVFAGTGGFIIVLCWVLALVLK